MKDLPDDSDNKIDINSKLDSIIPSNYDNGYDFYKDVMMAVSELRDSNTRFIPPCTSIFAYVLPYGFRFVQNESDSKIKVFLTDSPIRGVTEAYLEIEGNEDFRGHEIMNINLDGGTLPSEDASVTISKWAYENVMISKDQTAQLNAALNLFISYRPANMFPYPESNYSTANINTSGIEIYTIGASIISFRIKGTRIGVMIIRSFRSSSDNIFAQEVNDALSRMTSKDEIWGSDEFEGISRVTHLIIDVRSIGAPGMGQEVGYGSSSGSLHLAEQLINVLSPRQYPIYGTFDCINNPLMKQYASIVGKHKRGRSWRDQYGRATLMEMSDPWTLDEYEDWFGNGSRYRQIINDEQISQITLSNLFAFNGNKFNQFQEIGSISPSIWEQSQISTSQKIKRLLSDNRPLYDQQHLIFLTDGLCSSFCAVFLKHARQSKLGKVFGVGYDNSSSSMDIASSAAGLVLNSDTIASVWRDEDLRNEIDLPQPEEDVLPTPFERLTTRFTFTAAEPYTFDQTQQEDELLEFIQLQPDVIIPPPDVSSDENETSSLSIYYKLIPYFQNGICFEWETIEDGSCQPGTDLFLQSKEHIIWGRKCFNVTGQFSPQCAFSRCEDGYALKRSNLTTDDVTMLASCVSVGAINIVKSFIISTFNLGLILSFGIFTILAIIMVILVCIFMKKDEELDSNDQNSDTNPLINDRNKNRV
ncbi:MAG: hypothetical protein EZS28_029148 [Streblomastix strix]|uniref:Tail specific protease domain-containing protein n=1 Tax=Streblomastix strix TaxID=222440 RepID=A0A5J4UZX6_9EUKA|nr:MAG: hypothetical protein EZS28_029148 [Streblomastix strix]